MKNYDLINILSTHYRRVISLIAVAALAGAGIYFAPAIENQVTLFRAEAHDEDYEWHDAGPLYQEVAEYYRGRQDMDRWAEAFGDASRCFVGIGKTEEVIDGFDDIAAYWEDAGAPESALPYYLDGGEHSRETDQHAEAVRYYLRAASYYAAVGDSLDEATIRVYVAESHVHLGQPADARASYLLAVKAARERSRPQWLWDLAQLYGPAEGVQRAAALSAGGRLQLGRFGTPPADAVPFFEAALAAASQEADYELLSQLYFHLQQTDDASRTLSNFVGDYPQSPFANYGAGVIAWSEDDLDLAEEYLGRAAHLDAAYDSTYRSVLEHIAADWGHRRAQAELHQLNRELLDRGLRALVTSIFIGLIFKRLGMTKWIRDAMTLADVVAFVREERDRFGERRAAQQEAARAELRLQTLPDDLDAGYQLQILFDLSTSALDEAAAAPLERLPSL